MLSPDAVDTSFQNKMPLPVTSPSPNDAHVLPGEAAFRERWPAEGGKPKPSPYI